eukprot:CAMPEP_0181125864 /NCGR_PEP_ID=MMETSP1071-20121207/27294_1 /TAXON_ID=35127 /ORGANISM="Thalassiosira sp., Strain NH16" /LENGTH=50 /DNA_ID=CAMNT_0023211369 /DNA_START=134 /DNA_END=283 /DNA_ORIENTATION=+
MNNVSPTTSHADIAAGRNTLSVVIMSDANETNAATEDDDDYNDEDDDADD